MTASVLNLPPAPKPVHPNDALSPTRVKQVYLRCDMKNPRGLYADEVDLIEFAHAIQAELAAESDLTLQLALAQARRTSVARCVEFVDSRNRPLAVALRDKHFETGL
jgi:hypothetical protein